MGRTLLACVAGALYATAAAAQSSEIMKTMPADRLSGQSEIRKSRPAPAPLEAGSERAFDRVPPTPDRALDAKAGRGPVQEEGGASDGKGRTAVATHAEVAGDAALTRFSLHLSARVPYTLAKLANPYRIILELPDIDFRLPAATGQKGAGLVRAYRYGLFAPGKSRIVIETTQPVRIQKQAMSVHTGDKSARLVLDMAPTDTASYMADMTALPAVFHHDPRSGDEARGRSPSADNGKPIIVIDPGHGGNDAGAVGAGYREKDVVLAVAHQVREALEATGAYNVHMTRSTDVFITLGGRVAFSRRKGASLFVSIHANSIPTTSKEKAEIVRGAAVYTLSEAASNREVQRLADKENAADQAAGAEPEDNEVDHILADLKWREASEFSSDFRGRLLGHLKRDIVLSRDPAPSAPFMVLRQGDCPSVLVELGYISNARDVQLLVSPEWQRQAGVSIAAAIDDFFTHGRRP
jgi:N-acetylmuramoyl-L-alanine amidase